MRFVLSLHALTAARYENAERLGGQLLPPPRFLREIRAADQAPNLA
jgi:hypothetical protein